MCEEYFGNKLVANAEYGVIENILEILNKYPGIINYANKVVLIFF